MSDAAADMISSPYSMIPYFIVLHNLNDKYSKFMLCYVFSYCEKAYMPV